MKVIVQILLMAFCFEYLAAQDFSYNSEKARFPVEVEVSGQNIENDFKPNLDHLMKAPLPGGNAAKTRLEKVKSKIGPKSPAPQKAKSQKDSHPDPVVREFEGNPPNGIPNDNDLAISNEGQIVSVINSLICIYDTSGQKQDEYSLEAFSDTLGITGQKYDPRVLYDPEADRFVVCFLNGKLDSTSAIIVAFSETNDATGKWNLYSLPGNPLNDSSWSDFPMISMTGEEVFLTVNLLYNDSSWQEGFKQSIVWQIDKSTGYNGDSLDTRLYKDINLNGDFIRNLSVIKGGMGLKGPNMYMLSNHNFALKSDTFYLFEITGPMDDASTQLTLEMIRSDQEYGAPPVCDQPNDYGLATNDARVLDGFIENGRIHLVGNTVNPHNRASIYHGVIEDLKNPEVDLELFSHWAIEYGYPSVVFIGETPTDNRALITTNHAGDTINPGMSALYYKEGTYSGFATLKTGETYIDAYGADTERWGDYTGLQRKYNSNQVSVWGSGYFGKKNKGLGTVNVNGTWITQIQPSWPPANSRPNSEQTNPDFEAFPNPAEKRVNVQFELEKARQLSFDLYDQQGRHVKSMMKSLAKPGKNRFSFSLEPLKSGSYILRIIGENGEAITTKTLIKQ